MSIVYLFRNRERPPLISKRWFVVWVKRFITLKDLVRILTRRILYKIQGAKIGELTILGNLDYNGKVCKLTVGDKSFISDGVHVALHASIIIGNNVVVNSKVQLLTGTHNTQNKNWSLVKEKIVINDYAWIANGAIVLPGVTIGRGAVVGAGAVVSKDIPDWSIVVGNPAQILNKRRLSDLNYSPVDLVSCYEAWLGKNNG